MKALSSLLITLSYVITACATDMAQQEDSISIKELPAKNLSRTRNIDIKHIAIDLKFDWQKKQAYGKTFITLALLNVSDKIKLDAGMLTIHSIELSNGTALKFNYDGGDKNDGLEIILNHPHKANEELTIKIDYHTNFINTIDPNNLSGSNGKGLRFSEPTSNDPIKPKEIWSMGDPESNRYWFPGYDAPDDLRTTAFTATVDKKLTVISNGDLIDTRDNKDGTRSFHYKMNEPYANHLTSFVAGEYIDIKQNYNGINIHNFGYPNEKEATKATVVRLPDMIKYFSEATGVKYPFSRYSQVFVQDIGSFSGNNTVSTITENMVDDYGTHADFFYLWDLTEAEALAQQWFGNLLACNDWSQVWLNKSFAHYFNCLYNEHKNGRDEFLIYQHAYDQSVYLSDWALGYRHPVVTQNYGNIFNFTGDNYAAARGSLVLHMLRKQLGEENWWKVIKLYVKANANKLITTKDFLEAVEEVTGEQLNWFFEQWIYKMGHPIFEITKNYDTIKKQLIVNVKQTQTIDTKDEYPQVTFFKGKIDIEIDGRIEQIWLEAKAENSFNFAVAQAPKLVNFDYESTWIKEVKFEKTFDELMFQLQHDKDILGRQSAMIELGAIAKNEKASAENITKIQTCLKNIISGNAYWRLRIGAMSQLRSIISRGSNKPDEATITVLLSVIKKDTSWVRAAAIGFLGITNDNKYVPLYINALKDKSDRVINSAALALAKTKNPKAFDALAKLVNKPSMKSQSLISALGGLKELGDTRGFDIAFRALSDLSLPRWRLPNGSVWDYRIFAAQTIASMGKSGEVYPLIFERFKKSMNENDLDGILNNILLINALAESRGQEAFDLLKSKFKDDATVIEAVNQYELQFKEAIVKK